MTIRLVKILLALSVGLWGLIGLVGNLAGLSDTYEAVQHVTSMSGVPEDVGPPWRTSNAIIVSIGVVAIVLGKLAAVLAGVGGIVMMKNRNESAEAFRQSKRWAVAGAGLAFAMMFLSFTVLAETAFFMFFGPEAGAGELAFRYSASFALIALFLGQPEVDAT